MQFIILGMGLAFLLAVSMVALIGLLLFVRPLMWERLRWLLLIPLAPVAVGTILIGALLLWVAAEKTFGPLFGNDEFERYRAIFGRDTDMVDAQMLSDEFYEGWAREVWLRAEPNGAQLTQMQDLPSLAPAALDASDIASLGQAHQFLWWLGSGPEPLHEECLNPRIRRAGNVNGWREILLVECPARGAGRPTVYVLARGDLR